MSTISFFGTLVDTIKRYYEMPEILSVAVMPSLKSHAQSPDSVYQITTKSHSFVLRPFRNESNAAIELHNRFLNWAERHDFSMTQKIIQTREGENSFEGEGQRWWLSSYIEADPVFEWTDPIWSAAECEQAGLALSLLHQGLRHFAEENPSVIAASTGQESVLDSLEKRLTEAFFKASQFAQYEQLVARLVSNALQSVRKNAQQSIQTGALSNFQFVHGDFHPGNLLFRGGQAIAVIDFEYLSIQPPVYDLAYALVMFCTEWSGDKAEQDLLNRENSAADQSLHHDGNFDVEKLRSFLRGYLTDYPDFDLDQLIPYMNVAAAICLTWFLERELEQRSTLHFINVLKQLQNLSTMDISRAIGRS